jgi:hypothetical protein
MAALVARLEAVSHATITGDAIAAIMERAAARLRADGISPRLTLMPSPVDHVLAQVDADGWVEIGVIVDPDHTQDWRVWLNVETGEGRLRPWARR